MAGPLRHLGDLARAPTGAAGPVRAGIMRFRVGFHPSSPNPVTLARRYDQEAHAPFLGVATQRLLPAPLVFAADPPAAGLPPTGAPRLSAAPSRKEPTRPDPTFALTFVAALGCAVAAGVFFAFSTFVMTGLDRSSPGHRAGRADDGGAEIRTRIRGRWARVSTGLAGA